MKKGTNHMSFKVVKPPLVVNFHIQRYTVYEKEENKNCEDKRNTRVTEIDKL
jgi:hypothetical protein